MALEFSIATLDTRETGVLQKNYKGNLFQPRFLYLVNRTNYINTGPSQVKTAGTLFKN